MPSTTCARSAIATLRSQDTRTTARRPTMTDGKIVLAGKGTAHVVAGDAKKSFALVGATEREHALCGAALGVRSGVALDRNRLADLDDRGALCSECRSELVHRGVTLPATDGGGRNGDSRTGRYRTQPRATGAASGHGR